MSNNIDIEEWLKAAEKKSAAAKPKLKQLPIKKRKPRYVIAASASVIALLGIVLFSFYFKADNVQKVKGMSKRKEPTYFDLFKKTGAPESATQEKSSAERPPVVLDVMFVPARPVCTDKVKVDVVLDYKGNETVSFRYQWKVNGKAVEGAVEDTLLPGSFRKKDQVSVEIVPFTRDKEGVRYYNKFTIVANSPPTLELKEKRQVAGDAVTFELVSTDPDNDKVTFALEEPLLEGMSINKETGLVSWKPKNKEKGTFRFRASAVDTEGAKIAKTFEFAVDSK